MSPEQIRYVAERVLFWADHFLDGPEPNIDLDACVYVIQASLNEYDSKPIARDAASAPGEETGAREEARLEGG